MPAEAAVENGVKTVLSGDRLVLLFGSGGETFSDQERDETVILADQQRVNLDAFICSRQHWIAEVHGALVDEAAQLGGQGLCRGTMRLPP